MKNIDYEDRRKIREIHFKELQDLPEKHINILVAHSFVGHDSHDVKKKLNLVINAFRVLNMIAGIKEVLMVTAASKKFCIIFDFNRDSVQLMDPTVDSSTAGLFYLSGRIYIGAKQLLDSKTEAFTFATLAHELSHYAMYLTYHNNANPYKKNDNKTMNEVEKISILCEEQKEKEDVILMVYSLYSKEQQHAELIVRVPHLLALYYDNSEKINSLRLIYEKLFNLYEKKIVPEMIESIPEIESKIEKEIEKKDRKISKLKRFFIYFVVFGALVACLLGLIAYSLYTPNKKFNELSIFDQVLVKNSMVDYNNVIIKFSDIFSDENAYTSLTSAHIGQMIKGQTLNLSDPHLFYLNSFMKFKWENLAQKLKQKLLISNVTFQNDLIMLNQLYREAPEVFKFINSTQIKNILNGNEFLIGKFVKNETKFYVERKFIYEDMEVIYSNYSAKNSNLSFKLFMNNFLNRSVESIVQDIENYKKISTVIDPVNYNNSDIQSYFKDFDTIINETEKSKFFILSSEAGSGKTFTFVQFALKIKKMYPNRWVSYINLRDHANVIDAMKGKVRSKNDLLELLQKLLSVDTRNAFEFQLFKDRFMLGKIVLLWDGFDVIVPEYDDFILEVLRLIKLNTSIPQYISTRKIYSTILKNHLEIISHVLVPLDRQLQNEFLRKLLISKNVNESTISSKIGHITQIFNPIVSSNQALDRSSRELNTPSMLIITADISEEKDFKNNPNLFYIFGKFIEKKFDSFTNSSASIKTALLSSGKFTLTQFHQKYALKSIFLFVSFKMKINRLQIMKMKLPKNVGTNDISQIGILYLTNENEFEFAHKSIAEFYFAQYIVDNIYNSNDIDNEAEVSLRLELFFAYLLSRNQRAEYITIFLEQFLLQPNDDSQYNFNYKISYLIRTKFKSRFLEIIKQSNKELVKFMIDFIKKDHELLTDLLGINQIETFYTSIYKPSLESCITKPDYIRSLMINYLSENEYKSFINGVNQRGIKLFGMLYCYQIDKKITSKELSLQDEMLNHTSFINFFDTLSLTLNQNEQIELYKSAVDPTIYFANLFKNEIFTNFSMSDYENIWETLQNLSNNNTLILKNALSDSIAMCLDKEILNTDELLSFLLNKMKELFDPQKIIDIFKTKKLLFRAIRNLKQFKKLWNFITEILSKPQQKGILENIYDNDNEDSGCYFKIFDFNTFTFCFTGFKIFHFALLVEQQETFNYVRKIYEEHFSKQDLQDIALSSIDIYLYMIVYESKESCCYFVLYLKNLFEGNYKILNNFLKGKHQQTSINLLENFKNFRPMKIPELKAFESLKNITESRDNSTYDYCDNLLKDVPQVVPSDDVKVLIKKGKSKNPFLP
ncbi:hypothetical protein ACKWTF_005507 [Chironomus riparius]